MSPKPGPAQVYRFFGMSGYCLYTGKTQDFPKRWNHHASNQVWWDQVNRCTVDFYLSWAEASEVEEYTISTERPVYNVPARPPVVMYAVELNRLINEGGIPARDEPMRKLLWELTRTLASHLSIT